MRRGTRDALVIAVILVLMLGVYWAVEAVVVRIDTRIDEQQGDWQKEVERLERELEEVDEEQRRLEEELELWEDTMSDWTFRHMEITAYAPLDPAAIPGWDYCSAGPSATASGVSIQPGVSVAAGPSVPFGTEVRIQGLPGTRIVHDRGGRITDRHIDLAVGSKAEARSWGRQTRLVAVRY